MTMLNVTAATVGERLRLARLAAGLERRDLAQRIGVSVDTIGNWERGKFEPNVSQFIEWARATNQPVDRLIDGLPGCTPWDLNPEPTDSESVCYYGAGICPFHGIEHEFTPTTDTPVDQAFWRIVAGCQVETDSEIANGTGAAR